MTCGRCIINNNLCHNNGNPNLFCKHDIFYLARVKIGIINESFKVYFFEVIQACYIQVSLNTNNGLAISFHQL